MTGSLSGAPTNIDASASPLTIIVTASDGISAVSGSFNLSVLNDNNAPTLLSSLGTRLAIEDTPFFLDTSTAFDDPDGDDLNFSASGLPASLSLENATGVISGTPTNDDSLTTPLVITVSASYGSIRVQNVFGAVSVPGSAFLDCPINAFFATNQTQPGFIQGYQRSPR